MPHLILIVPVLALAVTAAANAQIDPTSTPPVLVRAQPPRALSEHVDRDLQRGLELRLRQKKQWARLIKRRRLAVGLVDLYDMEQPRYARVNGDVMMYAASLPKIAILLAAFEYMENGSLERTPEIDQDLNAMIRFSSNPAATRMIDRIGGLDKVNSVLTDPRFRFYEKDRGGGLWVGKRYAKVGRRVPDPISGTSHAATVAQVCRFYYQLATGRLISRAASAEMLAILVDPAITHKFVKPLASEAPGAKLYRKSGTWRNWHADSVLVWGPEWRRYILVAMVQSRWGETILQGLVGAAEEILHNDLAAGDRVR